MAFERSGRRRGGLAELARVLGRERSLAWPEVERVSEERLWWLLRSLEREALMVIAARAVGALGLAEVQRVLRGYAGASEVGALPGEEEPRLLAAVQRFCNHARQGHFHDEVPYRGHEESRGTQEFVARCQLFFDRAVAEGGAAELQEGLGDMRAAFEELMDLLREVDADPGAIVHLTAVESSGELGSACMGIDWAAVLPVYFRVLARTASQQEFAAGVDKALDSFVPERAAAAALRDEAECAWGTAHAS